MNSIRKTVRIVLLIGVLFCAESCQRSPIPMRTMKRIYGDMAIADATLENKPDLYLQVDTLAVYPAIFAKYGYTTEDFLEAQKYMITHPDKFSKMALQLKKEWAAKYVKAEREMAVRDSLDNIEYEKQQAILAERDNFLDSISFACLLDTVVVRYTDSLAKPDSLKRPEPPKKTMTRE